MDTVETAAVAHGDAGEDRGDAMEQREVPGDGPRSVRALLVSARLAYDGADSQIPQVEIA